MINYLKLFAVTIIIVLIGNKVLAQDKNTETIGFPDQTISEYKMYLDQDNKLDSAILLNTEFKSFVLEFKKERGEIIGGFSITNDYGKYLDYNRTRDILVQLMRLEQNKEDSTILENLRFKMQVKMANFPVSYADLQFVYRYMDLFSEEK
ncbi:MAG: hypothetical protein AB7S50_09130 [Bacteroidales bacterium]